MKTAFATPFGRKTKAKSPEKYAHPFQKHLMRENCMSKK